MAKSNKKKPRKRKKITEHQKLNSTADILSEFTSFLQDVEEYRKAPKASRQLVKDIFNTWGEKASKIKGTKHQAALIKSFGSFLI